MREIMLDTKTIKTYKTEGNLKRAIAHFPDTLSYVTVWTKEGRVTAVFTNALKEQLHLFCASRGFLVVG